MSKAKTTRMIAILTLIVLSLISSAQATRICLVVKDSNVLSTVHEKKVKTTLENMGFQVSLIDKNFGEDYSNCGLIVIAGRPGSVYTYEHLDEFVADIPVNDYPTIAIDSAYPDDWGWVKDGGISTVFSSRTQKIEIINDATTITDGYKIGDVVEVHIDGRKTIMDLMDGRNKLTPIASLVTTKNGVISIAEPNTELYNGKITKARIVFFGIANPLYWTDKSEELFRRSVWWALSMEVTTTTSTTTVTTTTISVTTTIPRPIPPGDIVYKDVDGDGVDETAKNQNNVSSDGYEVYFDPNSNTQTTQIDGDLDGMVDWIVKIEDTGVWKYWDPDRDVLTNILVSGNESYIDTNGDGFYDKAWDQNLLELFGLAAQEVDGDANLEIGYDRNNDGSFEEYRDPDNSSVSIYMVDGDEDGKNDFIIAINKTSMEPAKYWDPDDRIITNITKEEDNNKKVVYLIDVNGDGFPDKILVNDNLTTFPDLSVGYISFEPKNPKKGDSITISASITNQGGYNATNFGVSVLLDDVTQDTRIISLTPNSSTSVFVTLRSVSAGDHWIKVIADSENVIMEPDKSNNQRTTRLSVSGIGGYYPAGSLDSGWARFVDIPDTVEMEVGSSQEIKGGFLNNLTYELTDLEFKIFPGGLNSTWYKLSPEEYDVVEESQYKEVSIQFNIPEDAEIYTYTLTLRGDANSKYGPKSFYKTITLLLKEKGLPPETTTITTTTMSTTTTTLPEEKPKKSILSGLFTLVKANPVLSIAAGLMLISIILLLVFWKRIPRIEFRFGSLFSRKYFFRKQNR